MKRVTASAQHPPMGDARIAAILGWTGAACSLSAYAMASYGILPATNIAFPILNGFGAIGVFVEAMVHRTYPVLALNTVWFLIAVTALIRYIAS